MKEKWNEFLEKENDGFAILQLKYESDSEIKLFRSLASLEKSEQTLSFEEYNLVYTEDLSDKTTKNTAKLLDHIYFRFNLERPDDFKGHSLSISDIIVLKRNKKISFHYTDMIGFKKIADLTNGTYTPKGFTEKKEK